MTVSTKIRLYKNHLNSIGYWDIWYVDNIIHIEHATCIGCSPVRHTEEVKEGKQSRTIMDQVIHRIKSRINKQLDKGYVKTYKEAQKAPTNTLSLQQPMLAQSIKRVNNINWDTAYVQPKLDGHRCLITRKDNEVMAYSRQGKLISTIGHITDNINIPEGLILDGELYCDGIPLQEIASWAKKLQPNTKRLSYNIFDIIADIPFEERLLKIYDLDIENDDIGIVTTTKVSDMEDFNLSNLLTQYRRIGYEGVIVRHSQKGYEAGRRSNSLVKVKAVEDGEFMVVDITESKDKWAILTCSTNEGRTFRVSAPGTLAEKYEVMIHKDEYIGKFITLEYSMLTKDRIPFHPVALRWFTPIE